VQAFGACAAYVHAWTFPHWVQPFQHLHNYCVSVQQVEQRTFVSLGAGQYACVRRLAASNLECESRGKRCSTGGSPAASCCSAWLGCCSEQRTPRKDTRCRRAPEFCWRHSLLLSALPAFASIAARDGTTSMHLAQAAGRCGGGVTPLQRIETSLSAAHMAPVGALTTRCARSQGNTPWTAGCQACLFLAPNRVAISSVMT
jgi:hypothetical protein